MKYLVKEISADELQELERQKAASPLKQAQFERLASKRRFLERLRYRRPIDTEASWARLVASHPFLQPKPIPFLKRRAVWWTAAAALLIAATTVYWQRQEKQPVVITQSPVTPQPAIIPPPVVKAEPVPVNYPYLLTPGGDTIDLNTAAEGRLPGKDNVQFNKKNLLLSVVSMSTTAGGEGNYTLFNPTKKNYQIKLIDRTRVQLNNNSLLVFPRFFGKSKRRVQTSGETYFEVAKNKNAPFIVQTDKGTEVTALGTAFNISPYSDTSEQITMVEGTTRIKARANSLVLKAGEQVMLTDNMVPRKVSIANARQAIAWTNDMFDFRDRDIQSIMSELGRRYNLRVVFIGEFSKKSSTGKVSRNTPLQDLLDFLTLGTGVHAEVKEHQLIVTGH